MGVKKNQPRGAKYSLCIRSHWPLAKYKILRILGIFGGFWGIFGGFLKNPKIEKKTFGKKLKNYFLDNFDLFQKNTKKSQNLHFFVLFGGFYKNPRNLKIPPEWQPCWVATQNIAYVSAFIDPYPHMKFQVDILSGSKVTEGDGQTDHQTDGQTTGRTDGQTLRFLEIHSWI